MKKINQILIGTHNKGKFKEISDLLPKKKKISPVELNIESPIENGSTFIENSQIKAHFFCKKSNLLTLSDDSGLEVECLNNEPGIYSSRLADQYGGFYNAMIEILKRVEESGKKNTKAKFVSVLTIQWPNGKKISETGEIIGNISKIRGTSGFGYDPIFMPIGFSQTFGEMNYKKKLMMDHRFLAYKKLESKIKDYF